MLNVNIVMIISQDKAEHKMKHNKFPICQNNMALLKHENLFIPSLNLVKTFTKM